MSAETTDKPTDGPTAETAAEITAETTGQPADQQAGSPARLGLITARTALGPALLGTAFVATQHLPAMPLWIGAERVLPAGLLLILVRPALPRGLWWVKLAALGVINFGLFFALQAAVVHWLPGGVTSAITALQSVLVPVIAALVGYRPGPRQIIAAILGVAGVAALVVHDGHLLHPVGIIGALVLAACAAIGLVGTQHFGPPPGMHHLTALGWQMLIGGVLVGAVAAWRDGLPPAETPVQIGLSAWLALGSTAAAFALFFGGLRRLSASTVSLTAIISPVVATVLGWVIAKETLTALQLAGLLAVLTGLFLGPTSPAETTPTSTPAPSRPRRHEEWSAPPPNSAAWHAPGD